MNILYFSTNNDMIKEFERRDKINTLHIAYDIDSLHSELQNNPIDIIIVDYDSVAHDINKLLSENTLQSKLIILEKVPEILTGKMLVTKGIRAYGNSRMLKNHYEQMIDTVINDKVWTYPELTAALTKDITDASLKNESMELLQHKLSQKEIEVVLHILEGLTNDAIADKMKITTRTVKAHISSIFKKLHVNDRVALVLLLK